MRQSESTSAGGGELPSDLPEGVARCQRCDNLTRHGDLCGSCIAYDMDFDEDVGCYECGGEGFVSDCVEEWACVDPEYGCDYCTRRCPLCHPPKRNPELDAVLSDALALLAEDAPQPTSPTNEASP